MSTHAAEQEIARMTEPTMCKHCGEPIQPCQPWGWHHVDGPVLCSNESPNEATPPDAYTRMTETSPSPERVTTESQPVCDQAEMAEYGSVEPVASPERIAAATELPPMPYRDEYGVYHFKALLCEDEDNHGRGIFHCVFESDYATTRQALTEALANVRKFEDADASQAAEMAALRQESQRAMDLVRHQRAELHRDGLLSNEEFAALVTDSENGRRVARLESYDEMRLEMAALRSAKEKAEAERDAANRACRLAASTGAEMLEAAEAESTRLRDAGRGMANICYNLSQLARTDDRDREVMAECFKAWDAALSAPGAKREG